AYAEKYTDKRMQIVKGAVEYSGIQPIRNVRVCASGTCVLVRGAYPPLQSGAREPFSIEVPSLETVTVTTECSMLEQTAGPDRKSTRLNSSHRTISYAVFCLKKKKKNKK